MASYMKPGGGFLLPWLTVPALLMFPVLVFVYWRLAIGERREVRGRFGEEWDAYAARAPRLLPLRRSRPQLSA